MQWLLFLDLSAHKVFAQLPAQIQMVCLKHILVGRPPEKLKAPVLT